MFTADVRAVREIHMRSYFDEQYETRVYIEPIENDTEDATIDTGVLKNAVKEALEGRLNQTIIVVPDRTEADITVAISLTEYLWTEEDPVDMVFSPVAAAADKAKDEPYARMQADVVIRDAESGEEMWADMIQSTITDATMTREDSYAMSYERWVDSFTRELFKRKERR